MTKTPTDFNNLKIQSEARGLLPLEKFAYTHKALDIIQAKEPRQSVEMCISQYARSMIVTADNS